MFVLDYHSTHAYVSGRIPLSGSKLTGCLYKKYPSLHRVHDPLALHSEQFGEVTVPHVRATSIILFCKESKKNSLHVGFNISKITSSK